MNLLHYNIKIDLKSTNLSMRKLNYLLLIFFCLNVEVGANVNESVVYQKFCYEQPTGNELQINFENKHYGASFIIPLIEKQKSLPTFVKNSARLYALPMAINTIWNELEISNRVLFIKVKIEEIVRIGSQGDLFNEKT